MKIVAVTFDYSSSKQYATLAAVLKKSIEKNCPGIDFTLMEIPAPPITREKKCFDSNTVKFDKWLEFMEAANDDVIFMDCDMLVLKDLSDAFNDDFDIGLSKREFKLPYNGGVVWVKNNERAKTFIREWKRINDQMFKNPSMHMPYRNKYGGMNQASLGYLLEKIKFEAKIKDFPCQIWNCCQEDWRRINDQTRIIHVKSYLRKLVMVGDNYKFPHAANLWYSYARECGVKHVPGSEEKIKTYQYENYDEYTKVQKQAAVIKKDHSWADKIIIQHLSGILYRRLKGPKFGICHGTRSGYEQIWFREFLKGCEVVGTEIADYAQSIPHTIQHDFNKPVPEWIGKADFVYSNAFDHAFNPAETIQVWLEQLRPGGVLVLEHGKSYCHEPTKVDPFPFEYQQIQANVPKWTNNKFYVSCIVSPPDVRMGKKTVAKRRKTRFLLIERNR